MVLDDVKQIVAAQMHLSPDNVKDTTTFYDLVVEVIMALESKFDMILPDEAVETFKTVGDLANYIENQRS